ncbi:MAG: type I glutamate--ammonia ligase [Desulfuromonadales bacterium GWD2_61_12]|nr:MAG: type I glutamate--ammonia ligase [Desulfuromonadales bacterium GWC2_61_20]OGR33450.1 MAG: type I glutamate--ammonia ligase [Desulfuromonadales bacterium GWD2_61_12]HAD03747.1 type I glutamate--ammonia ligase [Desulfuromonas sp.]HBT84167.1 type I glutamate--ammonia ligase [Desulfuromonas sp.]
MTPKEVVAFAKENNCQMVDYKFLDFVGIWQHFTQPMSEFSEDTFEEGVGFDGSSIRGWQPIHNSDMLIMPDPKTAKVDPFPEVATLSIICNIIDPFTREGYSRDPRYVARKAEAYLKSTGLADTAYFGPEPEFFIFDDVRFSSGMNQSFYHVDSIEGCWNSGREEFPNLGYKPANKGGYFPVAPTDSLIDLRNEMVQMLQSVGIRVEASHHEVATGGQCEIDMRFDSLVQMADTLQWFKYIVRNVAFRNGKTVTFMPKPLFGDNGSGMHCHQSLWKDGKNLFAGDGYGGLSKMALYYIGGIIKHAKALCAFTNPGTNSYKRLVPGYEAPVNLAYSNRNRSASIRIPAASNPKAKRIEYRTPDPSCNGYLAFAAMLMAGLDGIENKIDPGDPLDKDIYGLSPEELKDIPAVASSLEDALKNLEQDHAFLLKGDVFTEDLIEKWIEYKMEAEVNPVRMRPVPLEFSLYFDC